MAMFDVRLLDDAAEKPDIFVNRFEADSCGRRMYSIVSQRTTKWNTPVSQYLISSSRIVDGR